MPNKKTKFNSRFPPARIKKIMQTDEEVGKVSAAAPVLISKALEHFIEALLVKASQQTLEKNAKTLTQSHIKQCINRERNFDFLSDLVRDIPDLENAKEDGDSTGQKRGHHKNNGKRRRKPVKNTKSQEESSSEEEASSTDSAGEEGSSPLAHPASSNRTTHGYGDSPEPSRVPCDRITKPEEHPQSVPASGGPSFAAPSHVAPSLAAPYLSMPNTNSAIPMGRYEPRKSANKLEHDDDYDE